jgi:uncharacterized paraquat-inducible protein A
MCTINKQSIRHNQRATQTIVLNQVPQRRQEAATKNHVKPVTCPQCNAIHYHYQLSCRNCSAYFLPAETPVKASATFNLPAVFAISFIGTTAVLLLRLFH